MSGFKRVLPFFLAGPISGPLLAGVVLNFKDGRPILACLYAIALIEITIFLPLIVASLGLEAWTTSVLQAQAQAAGITTAATIP